MENGKIKDTDLPHIISAFTFAVVAHHGQLRSGTNIPYIVHPIDVASILIEHGYIDKDLIIAALLHDVIEDTGVTKERIEEKFGTRACSFVLEVTDRMDLPKKEARKFLLEEKIPNLTIEARLLKLADGISNVRDTNENCPENWNRNLKLSYISTCEKVCMACSEIWKDDPPPIYYTYVKEVLLARQRLSK